MKRIRIGAAGSGFARVSSPASRRTPPLARSRGVAVLEDVASDRPRPLAVPHGEAPSYLAPGEEPDLLRAPDRGGPEILVDAGLEFDVALLEEALAPTAPDRNRPRASRDNPR